jgi:hypothetical protein
VFGCTSLSELLAYLLITDSKATEISFVVDDAYYDSVDLKGFACFRMSDFKHKKANDYSFMVPLGWTRCLTHG